MMTLSRSVLCGLLLSLLSITGCKPPEPVPMEEKHDHSDEEHGHGHDHGDQGHGAHTPHSGIMVAFTSGQVDAGFAELKLHDDKGDLEFWLTKDEAGKTPFDLPLGSIVTVTFPKLDKTVELKIRNAEKNEDEAGKGNIRDGETNYFIFPGDTGEDATFLLGKEFSSEVTISFANGDASYETAAFELRPH